jgi:predicted transposase YdaD
LLAEPEAALDQARKLLEADRLGWCDLADWVETVLIYKLPRLSREEIRTMLRMIDVELKDTRFYREVFAEGEEIGRREGRREGGAELLLRLLRRRLGGLTGEQEALVGALPDERLIALGEALLDFNGADDFAAWLARRAAP